MKRKIKFLFIVLAVCATAAFGVLVSGCSVVDKVEEKIEQLQCEHQWNDGETTKEATCFEVGEWTRTCLLCNKVETKKIAKLECVEIEIEPVEATCTKTGLTGGTKCAVCDKIISKPTVVRAMGHLSVTDNAVAATCTEAGLTEGKHCSRCNEVLEAQETIPATGHTVITVVGKGSTCAETGLTDGQKCKSCGEVYVEQEVIEKKPHSLVNGVCSVCGSVEYVFEGSPSASTYKVVERTGSGLIPYSSGWYRLSRTGTSLFEVQVSLIGNDWTSSRYSYVKTVGFVISANTLLNSSGSLTVSYALEIDGVSRYTTAEYPLNLRYYVYDDYIDVYLPEAKELDCVIPITLTDYASGTGEISYCEFTYDFSLVLEDSMQYVNVGKLIAV